MSFGKRRLPSKCERDLCLGHRLIPVTILSFKKGFGATAKCKPQNNRARVLHIGSPEKYPVSLSCGPFASQSMQNIRYPLCSPYYIHSIHGFTLS